MNCHAKQLGEMLLHQQMKLVTAESCTGGGVASAVTEIPGSSAWFERGFVTYSNESKIELLGVPETTIERYGAVSEETALAMAEGALKNSHAQIAISITGIAGPDGGSAEKPVGTVWFGFANQQQSTAVLQCFQGDRCDIRRQAVEFALLKGQTPWF
jgi:nicotinamide-nucleotide amidase